MKFSKNILQSVRDHSGKVVLPEGNENRIRRAAKILVDENIADEVLLISESDNNLPGDVTSIQPETDQDFSAVTEHLFNKVNDISKQEARKLVKNPLLYGAGLVAVNRAQGMVAGAKHPTADVLRPALKMIGTAENIDVVSSSFVMELPNSRFGQEGKIIFSDPAVIPEPDSNELKQIASGAVRTYEKLISKSDPKVAFLSFSTKGSAEHEKIDKIQEAYDSFQDEFPDLKADGELQVDAAIVPEVSEVKSPDSPLEGEANILVFPDLDAANIGYKLVERLGNASAYGPFLQGLQAPVNDLSRGCSVDDIVTVSAVTILQAVS